MWCTWWWLGRGRRYSTDPQDRKFTNKGTRKEQCVCVCACVCMHMRYICTRIKCMYLYECINIYELNISKSFVQVSWVLLFTYRYIFFVKSLSDLYFVNVLSQILACFLISVSICKCWTAKYLILMKSNLSICLFVLHDFYVKNSYKKFLLNPLSLRFLQIILLKVSVFTITFGYMNDLIFLI